jgi:murein L,D-transpeptidase YafK
MAYSARARRFVSTLIMRSKHPRMARTLAFCSQHRGKILVLATWLVLLPLTEPPATAMGSRPGSATSHRSMANTPEALLVQSLIDIQNNRLDMALKQINALLSMSPNFRLAHLIRGDLLTARTRAIATIGNSSGPANQLADFRDEARVRLQHYLDPAPLDLVPEYLLQFDPSQRNAVVVDTSKSRLYLYKNENGEPRYVADYYITSGKNGAEKLKEGDHRTPIGVYFVVDNLPKATLSDFYGEGAYPINYPNEWDKRLGKNGHGIWLHGVPSNTYSRPPRASNGCVVLANEDLKIVEKFLQVGQTPVIISNDVAWIDRKAWKIQRDAIDRDIDAWRRDWESLDTERYLSHYAPQFSNGEQSRAAWAAQKRAVNSSKTAVKVKLSNISVFRYPGKENMAVVTFVQDYRSNNLSHQMRKRQYWMQESNTWKIVYEGAA